MVLIEVSCLIVGVAATVFYFTCIPCKETREVVHSILYEYYDSEFLQSYTPPENAEEEYALI